MSEKDDAVRSTLLGTLIAIVIYTGIKVAFKRPLFTYASPTPAAHQEYQTHNQTEFYVKPEEVVVNTNGGAFSFQDMSLAIYGKTDKGDVILVIPNYSNVEKLSIAEVVIKEAIRNNDEMYVKGKWDGPEFKIKEVQYKGYTFDF